MISIWFTIVKSWLTHKTFEIFIRLVCRPTLYSWSRSTDACFLCLQKSSVEAEEDFVPYIGKWRYAGASLFGGCCRTTPKTIRGIAEAISEKPHGKSI